MAVKFEPRVDVGSVLTDADRESVYRWLREYNQATNREFVAAMEGGAVRPLIVLVRDDVGQVVGGLIGDTLLKWLRIHIMAVSPALRRAGIGTLLMSRAEGEAARRGCTHAYVDTMSHQSPEFYRRCGYLEAGRIPNWDSHGHEKYFFTKPLASVAAS